LIADWELQESALRRITHSPTKSKALQVYNKITLREKKNSHAQIIKQKADRDCTIPLS